MSQSSDIGQNSDGGISDFRISADQSPIKKIVNSRTSNDINMKLEPVTKIDSRTKTTLKNLTVTPGREILTSLLFFQIMANLEAGFRTQSVKLTFSLGVTFYLIKAENSKKSLTQLSHNCFE